MASQVKDQNNTPLQTTLPNRQPRVPVRIVNPSDILPLDANQKPAGSGAGGANLQLRLDLNFDVEVELKARVRGDLTLALL
jgi:hypothetical protein